SSGETKLEDVIRPSKDDIVDPWQKGDETIRRAIIAGNAAARRANIAGSHAYTLRALTSILACADQPLARRRQCLQDWDFARKDDIGRNRTPLLASLFNPAAVKVFSYEEQNIARLHCAWIALAAEQFRLQEGHWPQDT